MFVRKHEVHVMCPPPILEQLGWKLDENPDRDGDQKVRWKFNKALAKAETLGRQLASLL